MMSAKKWWQGIILFFLGALIFYYLFKHPETFAPLKNLTFAYALLLISLRAVLLLVNGLLLKDSVLFFRVKLSPKEWIGLSFVTALGNYLTPFSGGMVAKAGYLKRIHDLPLTKFAVLLASYYLIVFFGVAVVGFVDSLFIMGSSAQLQWQVPVFFGCVAAGVVALVILPLPLISSNRRLLRKIGEALEGWKLIRNDRPLILRFAGYTFLNIFTNGLLFFIAYKSLGADILFSHALMISLIAVFSLLVNITPANLGVQEAVVSIASGGLGQGIGEGLVVVLLIRAATMLLVFTLGPVFVLVLGNREPNRPQ